MFRLVDFIYFVLEDLKATSEFGDWAFGKGWDKMTHRELRDQWVSRHGKEILDDDTPVVDSLRNMIALWKSTLA